MTEVLEKTRIRVDRQKKTLNLNETEELKCIAAPVSREARLQNTVISKTF